MLIWWLWWLIIGPAMRGYCVHHTMHCFQWEFLYRWSCGHLTKMDRKRNVAFEMWSYRWLLTVSWKDKSTNKWVLERVWPDMVFQNNILQRKLFYFSHVITERHKHWKTAQPRGSGRSLWQRTSNNIMDRWHQSQGMEEVWMWPHIWHGTGKHGRLSSARPQHHTAVPLGTTWPETDHVGW